MVKIGNIIVYVLFIFCAQELYSQEETYEFYGRHFVVSYRNCDSAALENIQLLLKAFREAVLASGATILSYDYATFPGNGLTASFLLSESHATIHTYPEHNACFVDLFTCGHTCTHEQFDVILTNYLQAKDVTKNLYIRE
ncbi:S-adenosylmethionine decarboxylase proenzyme [candidate division TM6 bacterium RIFCSPHIGHO2_12_FULL_36_22]|nr:MAG: S-adenosylmethionine decarboxylase proenzyme [candidate division TM6 bacterium RIFCSPHIGHO2_12_FULL_36_22]